MGEHKQNPNAQAKAAGAQQNPAEVMRKMLDTPLTKEEGDKALAEIAVQVNQLRMMRSNIDQQLAAADFDRAVVIRRMLNPPAPAGGEAGAPAETPAMGAPVGGPSAEGDK